MDESRTWVYLLLLLTPVLADAWRDSRETRKDPREPREMRRAKVHSHSKRHMLPPPPEIRKRTTTPKPPREIRKKPSGHLIPLEDEDMGNEELVSVAIGPPHMRPKYEKIYLKKIPPKSASSITNSTAIELVKSIMTELGKDLLMREVDENFVFGQYVGNSMKNLSGDYRLSMQHEILDLIVKYQRLNRGDDKKEEKEKPLEIFKDVKLDKKTSNDTDETWPDFSNLAKIVG